MQTDIESWEDNGFFFFFSIWVFYTMKSENIMHLDIVFC